MAVVKRYRLFIECDTEAERDATWPLDSLIYCLDTEKYYKIDGGDFTEVPADEIFLTSLIPIEKLAFGGVPGEQKYLRSDGTWAEPDEAAVLALLDGVAPAGDTLKKLYDLIIGIGQFADNHDASGGLLPTVGTGASGAIDKSDYWIVSVTGTIAGLGDVKSGDVIYARINNAAVAADFFVVEKNQDQATDTVMGLVKLYTNLTASNTDGAASQAAVKAVVDLLATIIAVQNSTYTGASVSGTDTYTAALAPAITAYVKGQRFELTDVNANTVTNPTMNLNGLGVKNLLDYKGAALTVGVFAGTVIVVYDGTAFRMIGGGGSGGGSTAATTTFTPAGGLSATDVQAALQELDTEKAADADVVKLTGNQTVAGVKTFSSFLVTPLSAPTTNYQVANKKYVDDSVVATRNVGSIMYEFYNN